MLLFDFVTNRCKKWRIKTRRSDLDCKSVEILNKTFRLCSRHFEESQFLNAKHDKLGKLDRDAEHTAKFIDMFDRIFNACNSRTIKSSQPMGHAISNGSGHVMFFQDILAHLQALKPAGSKKELPCILGWQITIKSIIELWTNLFAEKKYKFLLTSRLNQDC